VFWIQALTVWLFELEFGFGRLAHIDFLWFSSIWMESLVGLSALR
jgi:hypothetical protein